MRFPEQICHLISRDIFFYFLFFFFFSPSTQNRRGQTDSFHLFRSANDRRASSRPDPESSREFYMRGGAVAALFARATSQEVSSLFVMAGEKKKKRKKRARREGGRERERAFVAFANRIRRQVLVHISRGELRTLFSGWRSFRGHRYRMVRTRGSSNRDGFSLFNGVRCFPFV